MVIEGLISVMTVHVLHAADGHPDLTHQVAQRHRDGAFRSAGFDNTSGPIASTIVLTAPRPRSITLRRRRL